MSSPISATDLIGVLAAAFVASPIIGFLIYAFYNPIYEYLSKKPNRKALEYIKELRFVKSDKKNQYKDVLKCYTQQKEFLDLIYHINLGEVDPKKVNLIIESSDISEVMKAHLSKYAARIVCGVFVPCFSAIVFGIFVLLGYLNKLTFSWQPVYLVLSVYLILLVSLRLCWGSRRVLDEAFQLEEYFVKMKKKAIVETLDRLSNALSED